MKNKITGRSAFLALLKDEGVTHLFGNPGTTELPIMHALKDHPDLTYVMAMQESLVVAMADGFSRASGKLVACNVHVAPGLGNAMGSLYNASFTGTPLILTAGQQEQGHGLTEPVLYGPLVQMAAAAGEMGGRGDAAGGSAAHRAPRRQDRDHAADRAGVHLAAGRHPQCRGRHRTRPFDPGRYPRQAVGRIAAGADRAHPQGRAARDHRRRRDRQERRVAGGGSIGGNAGLPGVSVFNALWRAFPVRKPVLHGCAGAHPEDRARHARALRPHHRARRRSLADVGLQRDRSAAGRACRSCRSAWSITTSPGITAPTSRSRPT